MSKKTFTCARCGKRFEKEEDAFRSTGGQTGIGESIILCDPCSALLHGEHQAEI